MLACPNGERAIPTIVAFCEEEARWLVADAALEVKARFPDRCYAFLSDITPTSASDPSAATFTYDDHSITAYDALVMMLKYMRDNIISSHTSTAAPGEAPPVVAIAVADVAVDITVTVAAAAAVAGLPPCHVVTAGLATAVAYALDTATPIPAVTASATSPNSPSPTADVDAPAPRTIVVVHCGGTSASATVIVRTPCGLMRAIATAAAAPRGTTFAESDDDGDDEAAAARRAAPRRATDGRLVCRLEEHAATAGGAAIDKELAAGALRDFARTLRISQADLFVGARPRARLLDALAAAKQHTTTGGSSASAPVHVDALSEGVDFSGNLTLAKLSVAAVGAARACRAVMASAIDMADVSVIDAVIAVGGTMAIPTVREAVGAALHPIAPFPPQDGVAAYGAAVHANALACVSDLTAEAIGGVVARDAAAVEGDDASPAAAGSSDYVALTRAVAAPSLDRRIVVRLSRKAGAGAPIMWAAAATGSAVPLLRAAVIDVPAATSNSPTVVAEWDGTVPPAPVRSAFAEVAGGTGPAGASGVPLSQPVAEALAAMVGAESPSSYPADADVVGLPLAAAAAGVAVDGDAVEPLVGVVSLPTGRSVVAIVVTRGGRVVCVVGDEKTAGGFVLGSV